MKDCKIVQDLLPLYAEDLIATETKEYILAHCSGCESCQQLLRRCEEPIPSEQIDEKAYKKALRKGAMNIICKVILVAILFIGLSSIIFERITGFSLWNGGRTPVEQIIEAPVGLGKVTLVDWEASGWHIRNARNEGTLIYIKQEHVIRDEHGVGRESSEGGHAKPWENVQVKWAPNGEEIFFAADLLDGGIGFFVETYEFWMDEDGSHSISGMLPEKSDNGFLDILLSQCRENLDFPTGWETIGFTFYKWKDDSETLVFVYETDNGHRGLLDFHFPSETITNID